MKRTLTIGIAILAALGLRAKGAESRQFTICMERTVNFVIENQARTVASGIFTSIGVKIQWHGPDKCPTEAVYVSFSSRTPASDHPGASAYALPYEGTHVVVFLDRVKDLAPSAVGLLLGYNMAHEITHILEGTARHSESGIMKAHWDAKDHYQMSLGQLSFAPEDVRLIYRRLDRRESRPSASAVNARTK